VRILATCSLGGAGHWLPLSTVLRGAEQRGDELVVLGPPALREMVEHSGFAFTTGGEPSEAEVAPIRERLPTASTEEASVLGNRDLFGRLAATAMLPSVSAICAEWKPDLVLRDPCEYASAVIAGNLGIPSAHVAISLAEVEWASLTAASPALEEHRHGLTAEIAATPYLSRFPETIDPSPFATTVRYRRETPPRIEQLPDWWRASTAPLVYVTLGTVLPHMSFAEEQYRLLLAALADVRARVLVTVGRFFDPERLGPLPPNVHVERWVDHDRVLAVADVVVCHGGSGTVFGALDAGVPLVVVPSFADQFANGELVTRHRLGEVIGAMPAEGQDGRRAPSEQDLPLISAAIQAVLVDASYRDRVRSLSRGSAELPSPTEVLTRLAG